VSNKQSSTSRKKKLEHLKPTKDTCKHAHTHHERERERERERGDTTPKEKGLQYSSSITLEEAHLSEKRAAK
jgi:hypothetical protein